MFTPFARLIPHALQKYGLARQARAALVCERYRKCSAALLPAEIIPHIWPRNFQKRILTLGVDHTAYAAELLPYKEKLIMAINEHPDLKDAKCNLKDIRMAIDIPASIETS